MGLLLQNFAISGYRSFDRSIQRVPQLAKINIFIGQNNSGKSNVLRFIQEIIGGPNERGQTVDALAHHLPSRPPMLLGMADRLADGNSLPEKFRLLEGVERQRISGVAGLLNKLLKAKAEQDGPDRLAWTFWQLPDRGLVIESWRKALAALSDPELQQLWTALTNQGRGNRAQHWEPDVLQNVALRISRVSVAIVPAIRRINMNGTQSATAVDGTGIIDSLAKLQNPSVLEQSLREGFDAITRFFREVTDRPDARIEVPYARDTILVHMDGKVLPIESLGSGIHEVLILAAASTVVQDHVVCMEEPELHLNPILQKKLVRYLSSETSNQSFITTHSAALMDTPGAEIYHVRLEDGGSRIDLVTSDAHRSTVCEDLGYHRSDLLQANCVIWVEGPSDRVYVNWWLRHVDPEIIEGIHYSVMFYGGRLAAHLTNAINEADVAGFISLRRLNRRGVILIDSDREKAGSRINSTKQRLESEFDAGPGHAWITEGREIENYISPDHLRAALAATLPSATSLSGFGRYENCLSVKRANGNADQAPKVDVAHHIAGNFAPDWSVLDLRKRVDRLKKFIHASNPKLTAKGAVTEARPRA